MLLAPLGASLPATANCTASTEAGLATCIAGAPTDGSAYYIEVAAPISLTAGKTVGAGKNITLYATDPDNALTKNVATAGFTVSGGGALTFAELVYNGIPTSSGALVTFAAGGGTLTLEDGAVFQNNASSGNGGAIATVTTANSPQTITINAGAILRGNTTTASNKLGGAIYTAGAATSPIALNITGTADNPVLFQNNATTVGTTSYGGAIYSGGITSVSGSGYAQTNITYATFDGNYAFGAGGAVYVNNSTGSTFSLTHSTFTNNSAGHGEVAATNMNGGAVYIAGTASLNGGSGNSLDLSYNTYTGNTGDPADSAAYTANGGAVYLGAVVLDVDFTGSVFTNNQAIGGASGAAYGGALYILSAISGSVTLDDTAFTGNSASNTSNSGNRNGGAVYFNGMPAELDIVGSTFTGNTAGTYGGAIYIPSDTLSLATGQPSRNGQTTIAGSTFSGNTAGTGGAIYSGNVSHMTVTDSVFGGDTDAAGNTALTGAGGGIYLGTGSTLTVNGTSKISHNSAATDGGGIWMGASYATGTVGIANPQLTVSGQTQITENKAGGAGGGVYVGNASATQPTDATLFYQAPLVSITGAQVAVSRNEAGTNGGGVYVGTNSLTTVSGATFDHNIAGAGGGGLYQYLSSTLTINNGAQFLNNRAAQKAIAAGGGVYLGQGTSTARAIATISGDVVFRDNVVNFDENGDKIHFVGDTQPLGGGAYAGTYATVTITDGVVFDHNKASSHGGGLGIGTYGILTIDDATFTDNEAGTTDHETVGAGGAIYLNGTQAVGTVAVITNSTLTGNQSYVADSNNYGGGAIYGSWNTELTLTDDIIADNAVTGATGYGGGVQVNYGSTVLVNGTTQISGNTASHKGGGISSISTDTIGHTSGGGTVITITGDAQVVGNTADFYGGGVSVGSFESLGGESTLTVSGNAKITGNSVTGTYDGDPTGIAQAFSGGGIMVECANATISGHAVVSDNTAPADGGGIYLMTGLGNTLSLEDDAQVTGNTAGGDGGGVWVTHDELASVDVGEDVVFADNSAATLARLIKHEDEPTYAEHVLATAWTATTPATLGYNNYDIAYRSTTWDITFDEQGGSEVADQVVLDGDSAAYPNPDSTRVGYTMAGWYEVLEGGDPVLSDTPYDFSTAVDHDTALQAVWVANTYLVRYLPGGGTGSMADQTAVFDQNLTLTANAFTRVGYTFAGWDANGDGVADYANQDSFKPWQRTENLTLTALWNANGDTPYTVEHYYVDAAGNPSATPFKTESLTAATDSTATATPVAAGDPLLMGHAYDPGFAATGGSGVVAGDGSLVLRLYYPVKTFTVTFVDGQGNTLKTEQVVDGGAATAPSDPTRDGYTFAGWDKAFDHVTGDLTVTALWTKNADNNTGGNTDGNTGGTTGNTTPDTGTGETLVGDGQQPDTTTTDKNTGDKPETDDETTDDTDDETDGDEQSDSASALTGGELSQANSLAALAAMLFAAGAVTLTAASRRRWQR
ncbi:MAG: InlB B-repeat-containing protein [Propionibacteriaceae bacterium]|nr:InlB B-repeat-containing protein [Propionibacteriaceae bacterium]